MAYDDLTDYEIQRLAEADIRIGTSESGLRRAKEEIESLKMEKEYLMKFSTTLKDTLKDMRKREIYSLVDDIQALATKADWRVLNLGPAIEKAQEKLERAKKQVRSEAEIAMMRAKKEGRRRGTRKQMKIRLPKTNMKKYVQVRIPRLL